MIQVCLKHKIGFKFEQVILLDLFQIQFPFQTVIQNMHQ